MNKSHKLKGYVKVNKSHELKGYVKVPRILVMDIEHLTTTKRKP